VQFAPHPAKSSVAHNRRRRSRKGVLPWLRLAVVVTPGLFIVVGLGHLLNAAAHQIFAKSGGSSTLQTAAGPRPVLSPQPEAKEVWECEVAVVGGSLGGVAAAYHAMQSGASTCLIELTPWLGGQVSSQGVSAIDESLRMLDGNHFSKSWLDFKQLISQQLVELPPESGVSGKRVVSSLNSCWVGSLCFPPEAGAQAAETMLKSVAAKAPGSRWETQIAFKGAEFDKTGKYITAVYGVRRSPRNPSYVPLGRLSKELEQWYGWASDETFDKTPIRLQAPAGKQLIVIDATDTGELVGWSGIPHRLGTESKAVLQETSAPKKENPGCTQAFTYPFVLGLYSGPSSGLASLGLLEPGYSHEEHQRRYDMEGFPMFQGKRSFFNYRRIVSTRRSDPFHQAPVRGDLTVVNWNRGNDWGVMNPPLILTDAEIEASGQHQNWMGGMSTAALRHAEDNAFLFAFWLLEKKTEPGFPLTYLRGADSPLKTDSGLSLFPYIREGRRIVGRAAYGQDHFMMREGDVREGQVGRDFSATAIATTHYALDIHGCSYRNGEETHEANSAPTKEDGVRPTEIPLEALIPQGVDNLLVGGKAIAVSHIVNAMTRIHYSEWSIGTAAGATAGWLTKTPDLIAADIVPKNRITDLKAYMAQQQIRTDW